KSSLPAIQWASNDGLLIWRLLDLIQKKENFVVLFGKQDPKENTSGDNKITVYERIAQELFPEDFQDHPKTLGKRVRGKTDDLCKIYKEKSALLCQTGGGVGAPEDDEGTGVHHYLDYYIPHDGPHHDTPVAAVNLWEQINKDFPYFSELHKFLSTRPNVVPPVITTGTGPRGRQVVHNQQAGPPTQNSVDDSQIDPALRNMPAQTIPLRMDDPEDHGLSPSSRAVRTNNRIRQQVKGPQPSTFGTDLSNAMERARGSIKSIPKKRSLEDVIIESLRCVFLLLCTLNGFLIMYVQ
ncbi:hypothetical protein C8F04DRAFT_953193, partial [Mycena alexandri]